MSPPEGRKNNSDEPPSYNQELSDEIINQELGTRPEPQAGFENQKKENTKPPSLDHVQPEDLHDTARLLTLFELVVALGLRTPSEADRLTFVALAEYALRCGRKPVKLFMWLVRSELWSRITAEDEDRARRRLRRYWFPPWEFDFADGFCPDSPAPNSSKPAKDQLDRDIELLFRLRRELPLDFLDPQAFGEAIRLRPEELASWTAERWNIARVGCLQGKADALRHREHWQEPDPKPPDPPKAQSSLLDRFLERVGKGES